MKNKKNLLTVCMGLVCVLLIGAVGYTVYQDRNRSKEAAVSSEEDPADRYITYNGKKYKKNVDIRTVLFLGVDKDADAQIGQQAGDAGQADSLNLLVLDRETNEAQIIQISRDSVVDVDIYNSQNELVMTTEGQIALQYAFGDGEKRSCRMTAERVSELLGGVEIDSYAALSVDGVVVAADAVGGVPITVPEDYTDIDPAFQQGAELVLEGELAEKYVRGRDTGELDSNNQRMERQSQFMEALMDKLKAADLDTDSYLALYQEIEPYMTTNMTAEEMADLREYDYAKELITLPGEVIEKDGYAQYLTDAEKIQEILVKYFYKPV